MSDRTRAEYGGNMVRVDTAQAHARYKHHLVHLQYSGDLVRWRRDTKSSGNVSGEVSQREEDFAFRSLRSVGFIRRFCFNTTPKSPYQGT